MESTKPIGSRGTTPDVERREIVQRGQWSRTGGKFNEDDLIDAYEIGKEKGTAKLMERVQKQFEANRDSVLDESERLYFDLRSKFKLIPENIFVRIDQIYPFEAEVLYLVPSEDFSSQSIIEVYRFTKERERELSREGETPDEVFSVSFRFMPSKESTNVECIISDGFNLKYERDKGSEPAGPRPA